MTQQEIAKALGLSLRGYQNYERDQRSPSEDLIRAAWSTFGVDPVWLLTGEGSMIRGASDTPSTTALPGKLSGYERRISALLGLLESLDRQEMDAVITECITRAEAAKQLAELRRAVMELEAKARA
jgi:transcriptional regulator with XRE-family HTH domain